MHERSLQSGYFRGVIITTKLKRNKPTQLWLWNKKREEKKQQRKRSEVKKEKSRVGMCRTGKKRTGETCYVIEHKFSITRGLTNAIIIVIGQPLSMRLPYSRYPVLELNVRPQCCVIIKLKPPIFSFKIQLSEMSRRKQVPTSLNTFLGGKQDRESNMTPTVPATALIKKTRKFQESWKER